jgi:hypothetical protein
MEAACSCEMYVNVYQAIHSRTSKDRTRHRHHRAILKSECLLSSNLGFTAMIEMNINIQSRSKQWETTKSTADRTNGEEIERYLVSLFRLEVL